MLRRSGRTIPMNALRWMLMGLDPSLILHARGFAADPWQQEVLRTPHRRLLLNCCRQAGKSTVVAALALDELLFRPRSLVLILSPGLRQSAETFRKVLDGYRALGQPLRARYRTQFQLELVNGSRVLSLPGVEE